MAKDLTAKQRAIFEFICETIRVESRPPTVREISEYFGFQSPKAATDHLTALERKGYISRPDRSSRNIVVREELDPQGIPVVGRIAAGEPLLAIENIEESLSTNVLYNVGARTMALKVDGESMTGAGILPGDYVIVENGQRVRNGKIGAVRIGDEATVKRVFIEKAQVRLQAENPDYKDIIVNRRSPEFEIIGPVIGVMRRL
jgi:repressor LexA